MEYPFNLILSTGKSYSDSKVFGVLNSKGIHFMNLKELIDIRNVIIVLVASILLTMLPCFVFSAEGGSAEQQTTQNDDSWESDPNEEDVFGNIMWTSFPQINKVAFRTPESGKPFSVMADISLDDEIGESKLSSVSLIYYINGALDKPNQIEMTESNGSYWAVIPPMSKGTKVDFIIRAEDDKGNAASQAVPSAKVLVSAVPDIDNSEEIVPDDMDLLQFSAGYDEKYMYVSYTVQGKISGGTLDPPYIQAYMTKVSNPDIHQFEGLMVGQAWIYLPLTMDPDSGKRLALQEDKVYESFGNQTGKAINERIIKTGSAFIDIGKMMQNEKDAVLFDVDLEAKVDGGKFFGRIDRKCFGENPSGCLRFIVITLANAGVDTFMPIPLNCTHYFLIYTSSQSYTVQ